MIHLVILTPYVLLASDNTGFDSSNATKM